MSDPDDLDQLREQTTHGDRLEEATTATTSEPDPFVAAIRDELEAIDAGEKAKTVSVWDGPLAAYIRALEAHPDHQQAVGEALQAELDVEPDAVDRSELLRLALRVGFQTAAPDQFESLREAVRDHATKTL